jgi:hypothetical protein
MSRHRRHRLLGAGGGGLSGRWGDDGDGPDGAINGLATAKTRDSAASVQRFFATQLKEGGFEVTTSSVIDGRYASVSADKDDGKTTVGVTMTGDETGEVQLVVTYQQAERE